MAQDMAYQPLVLVDTAQLTRLEWLEYRRKGLGGSDAPPVSLNKAQSARVTRFLELQKEKGQCDADAKTIEAEMKRLKALIVADMGTSCSAISEDGCTITWNPVRKSGGLQRGPGTSESRPPGHLCRICHDFREPEIQHQAAKI